MINTYGFLYITCFPSLYAECVFPQRCLPEGEDYMPGLCTEEEQPIFSILWCTNTVAMAINAARVGDWAVAMVQAEEKFCRKTFNN